MTSPSDLPDRLNGEGLALAAQGHDLLAETAFRQAAALAPSFLSALGNLANAESRRRSFDGALRHYRCGLALAPQMPQLHMMRGTAEIGAGQPAHGALSLRRAILLSPAYASALVNLGTLLSESARQPEAIIWFRRALAVDQAAELALAGVIRASAQEGHLAPVPPVLRRAAALHPSSALVHATAAEFHAIAADLPSALRHIRRAVAIDGRNGRLHEQLLFALVLDPDTTESALFDAYRRWARGHAPSAVAPRPPREKDVGRVLDVGYLSSDLYDHPIAYLVEDLIARHDRSQVRPWLFPSGVRTDATSRRLAAAAHAWRSVVGLSDAAAAEAIAASGIDILVILAGHTGDNRVLIAAHRPAPIQVNLHDLSTSGLEAVDYWLTDRHLHPEDSREGRTEALWRLENLYLHRWPEGLPAPSPPPALARGHVTFGCFANPTKLNERVLALWARTLRAAPKSRILFAYRQSYADPLLRERFRRRLQAHGIEAERIGFDLRRLTRAEHLARAASVDISLDPFPFTGGTATFEAFAVGVPVVTLAGSRFAARCGVSHLAQVGLEHLVAGTEDDYVRIAANLAQDLPALATLRAELPSRTRSSPLGDAPAYARAVEAAYRGMWRKYCAG